MNNVQDFTCAGCKFRKAHRLPFNPDVQRHTVPREMIHSNVNDEGDGEEEDQQSSNTSVSDAEFEDVNNEDENIVSAMSDSRSAGNIKLRNKSLLRSPDRYSVNVATIQIPHDFSETKQGPNVA
ncbi:hypothetical protein TKK_0012937 [Trichogramma kaykai]